MNEMNRRALLGRLLGLGTVTCLPATHGTPPDGPRQFPPAFCSACGDALIQVGPRWDDPARQPGKDAPYFDMSCSRCRRTWRVVVPADPTAREIPFNDGVRHERNR